MTNIIDLHGWKQNLAGNPKRTLYACGACDSRTFKVSCSQGADGAWGAIVVECANCETPQSFRVEIEG